MSKILSFIGWVIINAVGRTLRIREINGASWKNLKTGAVFAFWHGEQFIPFYVHRNQNVAIMSSLSKDGEIQAGILRRCGYIPVRGSSSRGAERALVGMIRHMKKGRSTAYAVDGPRGPLHEIKPGAVYTALKSGCPLIPVSSSAQWYKVFSKAWDQYELPLPFSKAVIAYGEPIYVTGDDTIEYKSRELRSSLLELSSFTHKCSMADDIKKYLALHPRARLLIIQPSRIGDVIFSLPALSAIRKQYPHAWIGWVVDERCAPLLEGNTCLDEVIVFDRSRVSLRYLLNFRRTLRRKNADISIDFHGLFKSAFLVWCAGARFRIGSASTNGMRELSWLFSKEIAPQTIDSHCVERHLAVANYLGCNIAPAEYPIAKDEQAAKRVDEILSKNGIDKSKPLIAIHPGGGWTARRWHTERFAELIARLQSSSGAAITLVGGREGGTSEKGLNEEIVAQVSSPVTDMTGKLTLKELIALLRRVDLFIANEAGPLHIATALGIPAIAILGPTDPRRTGPFGGKTRVIRHEVECQPCRNRGCTSKECMELITVEEVFSAATTSLQPR